MITPGNLLHNNKKNVALCRDRSPEMTCHKQIQLMDEEIRLDITTQSISAVLQRFLFGIT